MRDIVLIVDYCNTAVDLVVHFDVRYTVADVCWSVFDLVEYSSALDQVVRSSAV